MIIVNTSSLLGVKVEENLRSLHHSYVIQWFLLIVSGVNKVDALEGFENERHDNLEGVLSEGLTNTDALSSEEGHERHGVVMAALSETLRFVGVVVLAPLILIVMKLIHINYHHVASTDLNTPDLHALSHAERRADRYWGINSQGLIQAVLQVIVFGLIEDVHFKLFR